MFENDKELQKILETKNNTGDKEENTTPNGTLDKCLLDLKNEIIQAKEMSKLETGNISALGTQSCLDNVVGTFMDLVMKNTDYKGNDVVEMILYSVARTALQTMAERDLASKEDLRKHLTKVSVGVVEYAQQYQKDNDFKVSPHAYMINVFASVLAYTIASMN